MGRNFFVVPTVVRLPLFDGTQWIEVKKKLTVAEARRAMSSYVGSYTKDGARTPNLETLGMGQVLAYLVDWSFRDPQTDKPVPVSLDAVSNLEQDVYVEIDNAIEAHILGVQAEDEGREKKIPASGEPASPATS
jgi:hypothetical protein